MEDLLRRRRLRERVPSPRPFLGLVLVLMRVFCRWKQNRLASALQIEARALSRLELGRGRGTVPRDLLRRAAQVMGHEETFIDELVRLNWVMGVSPCPAAPELEAVLDAGGVLLAAGYRLAFGQPSEARLTPEQMHRLATERALASEIWCRCFDLPLDLREEVVTSGRLPMKWALAERVWLEGIYGAGADPGEALALAKLARAAAATGARPLSAATGESRDGVPPGDE